MENKTTSPLLAQMTADLKTAQAAQAIGRNIIHGYIGIPGIGKTEMVRQAADVLGLAFFGDMVLSCCSPLDIIGKMPNHDSHTLSSYPNSDIPTRQKVGDTAGVWFIDEVTNASQDTLKAMQQGLLSRRFGSHELGPNVIIILAGNRRSDKAGSSSLSTALYNRVTWRECQFTAAHSDAAIAYLSSKYDCPAVKTIAGYFYKSPIATADFDSAVQRIGTEAYTQWCSPRSLEALLCRLTTVDTDKPSLTVSDMAGDIGLSRAAELYAFMNTVANLPDYDAIISKPNKTPMPKEPAELYALASMCAARTTADTLPKTWQYISRSDQNSVKVVYLQLCLKFNAMLAMHPTFLEAIIDPELSAAMKG